MKYIIFAILAVSFCSCQKVINVNLNSSSPKYVVTGNIANDGNVATVSITKSLNFDKGNNFPDVSGAVVYITDATNNITDTLTQATNGMYVGHNLTGIPGHSYHLRILYDGQEFTATSTMPTPVLLDSIYTQASIIGNNTNVVPLYHDPATAGNYYHFVLKVLDSTSQEVYIRDDETNNGSLVKQALRNDINISNGDSVMVEMQCVDYGVYRYYQTLGQTMGQNSASPANPLSNISGGALGYFSAHTVNRKKIIANK